MRYFNSSAPTINVHYLIVARWFHSAERPMVFDIEYMHMMPDRPRNMAYPIVVATIRINELPPDFPKVAEEDSEIEFDATIDSYVKNAGEPTDIEESRAQERQTKFTIPIHYTLKKANMNLFPHLVPKKNFYILGTLHFTTDDDGYPIPFIEATKIDFTTVDYTSAKTDSNKKPLTVNDDDIIYKPIIPRKRERPPSSRPAKFKDRFPLKFKLLALLHPKKFLALSNPKVRLLLRMTLGAILKNQEKRNSLLFLFFL
jgi:hypothetical protein